MNRFALTDQQRRAVVAAGVDPDVLLTITPRAFAMLPLLWCSDALA
jgi:hypothetical protein